MPKFIKYTVSTGEIIDRNKNLVQPADFRKFDKSAWIKGFKYTPTALSTTEFSEKFTEDIWLWGGAYQVSGAHSDDYIEFEIVDLDNILGFGAGVVLSRYLETSYVIDNEVFDMRAEDGSYVVAGLYLRARYVANGTTSPVLKVRYYLRKKI